MKNFDYVIANSSLDGCSSVPSTGLTLSFVDSTVDATGAPINELCVACYTPVLESPTLQARERN